MKTAEDEEFERIEREIARRAREDDDTACYQSELNAAVLAEREACAKVCDDLNFIDNGTPGGVRASNRHCAAAIRARGQA